jgi:hypothetical protein
LFLILPPNPLHYERYDERYEDSLDGLYEKALSAVKDKNPSFALPAISIKVKIQSEFTV